ncbi:MAG: hypothetical protein J6N15_11300 [Ruminiclostridium sp.]|nr:hypothetical protein [Ruminiclostridium sp.]
MMGETLKKGKFSGLLYRELYLSRKSIITGIIMFAVFAAFGWLLLLSTQFGNLAKLFTELEVTEEQMSNIRDSVFLMMKGLPSLISMQFIFLTTELAGRDELVTWQRFARCSPVTPAKRAAVRMSFLVISAAASFLLPIAYIAFIDALQGQGVSYDELSVLSVCVVAISCIVVLAQVYIMLFHSMDRGMLALMGTILVPVWIYAFTNGMGRHDEELDLENALLPFCRNFCPFAPLVFFAVLAADFTIMYLLYKRREK